MSDSSPDVPQPRQCRVLIVDLTAHAAADVEAAVRDAGGDGLFVKPVDPASFRDAVRRHLADLGR